MKRLQCAQILKDLEQKMVILVGPRQVGKTWLAREIATHFTSPVYLNYDNRSDREIMMGEQWLPSTDLLILDEVHKMDNWQVYLKGIYDTRAPTMRILVTGSARMDLLTSSGESLAGRYFRQRLLPLGVAELYHDGVDNSLERLIQRGGFPEPFATEEETDAQRWRSQYLDGIIRYDILDFQRIIDFKALQLTADLLRERVGSPVSASSLARDIGSSPATVLKYIALLEALFLVFRVTPFSHNIARSLLKEPKIYFYDTGLVKGGKGARLENLVAVSLLKDLWGRTDCLGETWHLHYLRTKEGREVDFAVVNGERRVVRLVECKSSDTRPDKNLIYFSGKYSMPAIQLISGLRTDHKSGNVEMLDTQRYLSGLFL